jgi:hypothetical protein
MYFLIAQLVWIVWATGFPHFQSAFIPPMRDYVPINNPYKKAIHARGLLLSCVIAMIIGVLLFYFTRNWLECVLAIPVFFAIYEILFNGVIGLEVYDNFFFIGSTAKHDIWLNKHFPHGDGGEVKTIVCAVVIAGLNVLNYFL